MAAGAGLRRGLWRGRCHLRAGRRQRYRSVLEVFDALAVYPDRTLLDHAKRLGRAADQPRALEKMRKPELPESMIAAGLDEPARASS